MTGCSASELAELMLLVYSFDDQEKNHVQLVNRISEICSADGAALLAHDLRSGVSTGIAVGYDVNEFRAFQDYYCHINPWMPADSPALAEGGTVIPSESFFSLNRLQRTEFYNDWGKKNGVVFSLGANLGIRNGYFRYLCVNRSERSGPHLEKAEQLLLTLVPHVQNALKIREKLNELQDLRHILDSVALPVFLIGRDCHILEMTDKAKMLVEKKTVVSMDRNKRLSFSAANSPDLREQVEKLRATSLAPFRIFLLNTTTSTERVPALLLKATYLSLTTEPTYLLMILRPKISSDAALKRAADLYNLTPAQFRLVRSLLETGSLSSSAEQLRLSRNTNKTQLRMIFAKTGTKSQSQLTQLLSFLSRITQEGEDDTD